MIKFIARYNNDKQNLIIEADNMEDAEEKAKQVNEYDLIGVWEMKND